MSNRTWIRKKRQFWKHGYMHRRDLPVNAAIESYATVCEARRVPELPVEGPSVEFVEQNRKSRLSPAIPGIAGMLFGAMLRGKRRRSA